MSSEFSVWVPHLVVLDLQGKCAEYVSSPTKCDSRGPPQLLAQVHAIVGETQRLVAERDPPENLHVLEGSEATGRPE